MRSGIVAMMLVLGAGIVACSSRTNVVSADANTVQVRYSGTRMEDPNEAARKYCREYGRTAQLRQTLPDTNGQHLAVYDCIPR
ncbi:MAG TPA: hypothetical protein VGB82_20570 [Alphaproteobacteria bacterium]